ncbi:MAG: 4Fe-4S dicluster domain-containing protein [Anaerolineae bacterium]|nr:4Fe-4S dicluster domain-containing protein [Anaerolineae bacterium]
MKVILTPESLQTNLQRRVEEASGQNLMACYQCGKCSAGCPVAGVMDLLPSQVIRLVQLGLVEEAMASQTIWYCAACLTCAARCPKGVDLPRVMEALRELVMERGGDHLSPGRVPAADLAEWPQQAFVGGFRKYTS